MRKACAFPLMVAVIMAATIIAGKVGAQETAAAVAGPESGNTTKTTGQQAPAEEPKPNPIEPQFVRPLTSLQPGTNDSNPVWSPGGEFLSFERSSGDRKEIQVVWADGRPLQKIYYQLTGGPNEMQLFLPGIIEEVSYNAGITWSPGQERFVFMSNGGQGNYDLYLRELGVETTKRLTEHKEKDGQAHWSPSGDRIAFVSGRSGKGDLYLMPVTTRAVTRLTFGGKPFLYPQWSPDGKRIALTHGSNENHDIYLIEDLARPQETLRPMTSWPSDELRPIWSPDGKKIAFYSNYNEAGDQKIWCLMVLDLNAAGLPTAAASVVATDIVPDVETGPAWTPDSTRIVYVKNDKQEYNPLYVIDLRDGTNRPLKTDTKMNHDVACSADGLIAFRAQVDQWDHIFLTKLKE